MKIKLRINGETVERNIDATKRLIDFLRDDMELTGVKEGCSAGECGACTVILDGKAVTSCTVLAGQVDGADILTVEGLEKNGELDDLQKAFIAKGAIQCGFCTPDMLMSCKALLQANPDPSTYEIKRAIEGNLCRCTGYNKIVESVKSVAGGCQDAKFCDREEH